ncbi:MAG: NAD(P)-binding protein [Gammaproteobacteria bacterium]|nr:NAD(P)-binding protein [Gammaproteobacteria bacterium]
MHTKTTRRDLCQGIAVALGAAPFVSLPREAVAALLAPDYYPPALTGLRGSHVGSFEVAHALARDGQVFPRPDRQTDDTYDLVIVGAGLSGLSAAWFYRRERPDARVLLLDNHDDFGGHAKRNEFRYRGRTILSHGGSQSMDAPGAYSSQAKELLKGLGIVTKRFHQYYDRDFFERTGLASAIHFDADHWGRAELVRGNRHGWGWKVYDPAVLAAAAPLSETARHDLKRLLTGSRDHLAGKSRAEKIAYLARTSYEKFLLHDAGIAPEVLPLLRAQPHGLWGVGTDALSALEMYRMGFPGFAGMGLGKVPGMEDDGEPYIFHFPDGNASIARLLVRQMIPASTAGATMEDIVTARTHYETLDQNGATVRIRLNSTVVNVTERAGGVEVVYSKGGAIFRVAGNGAVLACHHAMIPYICPQLPEAQRQALALQVKVPLLWTSVLLDNWRALRRLGISSAYSPTGFYSWWSMDFPVSMGDYRFSASPDEPVVLYMIRAANGPIRGLPARDQFRNGRMELLNTPFETLERQTRRQLAETLGGGGFDPERDIQGITINRWPHGYAYEYIELWDPEFAPGEAPHEIARRPFGRIAIANSDAEAHAYVDGAIDAAHRAVRQLS